MDNITKRIVKEEPKEVLSGILMDLVEMDKKNEDRVKELYYKQ